MQMSNKLKQTIHKNFFMKDTISVARNLLGCHLIRKTSSGSFMEGRIVETEAYLGIQDSCCHSFNGLYSERTKNMYLEGGHAYVYFTYGMYHCFNIVTGTKSQPEAVLIRALEPLKGIKDMEKNRNQTQLKNLTTGPGKLCQAFDITRDFNGTNLIGNKHLMVTKGKVFKKDIVVDARIGLSPKKEACYWPLRFYLKNNPYISTKKDILL